MKTVFQAVLGHAEHERAVAVAQMCAGDEELQREVESLLIAYQQAGGFIELPAVVVQLPTLAATFGTSLIDRRLGPYRLIRELGRGGMGAVYLATRDDAAYKKDVAIKVILGGFDSEAVLKRFRQERQILAALDHPCIARLIDGGTTADGIAYVVMEYVEGVPLDRYCEDRRLGLTDRLKLFRAVCSAVNYAHQHLVVHRDLKPTNILVTAEGTPKLLDFGIAKLLAGSDASAQLEATMTGARMLTP